MNLKDHVAQRIEQVQPRPQVGSDSQLTRAVNSVGGALRKLASAASLQFGSDCFLHAELGRLLMQDHGFDCRRVLGFAAWRVGDGDGDVISHTDKTQGYLLHGAKGFPYHAWLEFSDFIIDFTTYQLARKAAELDALDGGHTTVEWCPQCLVVYKTGVRSYKDVAQLCKGLCHYEERPEFDTLLAKQFRLDPADLDVARMIMANPGMQVFGPPSTALQRDVGFSAK
jgi:hypothetical protein